MNAWFGRGGLNVRRYWIWKERQGEAQGEILADDVEGVYFCNIVAVLPEAQRRGVGRALMRVVLEKADKEGRRCYLESSRREPNVSIYEKFGFRLVREMLCEDEGEGVMLYCMTRDPVHGQEAERTEQGECTTGEPVEARVDS
jgi:GNAT superfamily N-acetyltransferase